VKFLVKTIFGNFFRGKFQFFPTFLRGKFSAEFSLKFYTEKMYEKSAPGYVGERPALSHLRRLPPICFCSDFLFAKYKATILDVSKNF
jgi:hypothetical protein